MRYCLILSLLIAACSGSTSVPSNIIQPEKMQAVFFDVIKADELVDFYRLTDSSYYPLSRRTAFYDSVFQLHGVAKKEFQQSLRYYQGRPDLLKEIFDGMHKTLTDTTRSRPQRDLQKTVESPQLQ